MGSKWVDYADVDKDTPRSTGALSVDDTLSNASFKLICVVSLQASSQSSGADFLTAVVFACRLIPGGFAWLAPLCS